MKNEERIQMIEEAIELIEEAMMKVDDAINGTDLCGNYMAYSKYGFDTILGNGNPYDSSLYTLIEELEKQ